MAQVAVTMTGDGSKLERELVKLQARAQELEARIKGVGTSGKTAGSALGDMGKTAEKAFDTSALLRWTGILAPGGVLIAGIKAVQAELTKVVERQKEMAAASLSVESSQLSVLRNLSGAPVEQKMLALQRAGELSLELGIKEQFVNMALEKALSMSGSNLPASLDAVREAGLWLRDKPEEIGDYAGAMLMLSKASGIKDAKLTRAFLSQIGSFSAIADPRLQATNIPPAMLGMTGAGATAREAAAFFAALTGASGDVTGAMSGTASIQFAEQSRKFFADMSMAFGPTASIAMSNQTMGERIGMLQGDRRLASVFLEDASFDAKMRGPIRSLLVNMSSEMATTFKEFFGKIGEGDALSRIADADLSSLLLSPQSEAGEINRRLGNIVDQFDKADQRGAVSGVLRERVMDIMKRTGGSALVDRFNEYLLQLNTEITPDEAIGYLEGRKRSVKSVEESQLFYSSRLDQYLPGAGRPLTETEGKWVQLLENAVHSLQEIRENTARARGGAAMVPAGSDE